MPTTARNSSNFNFNSRYAKLEEPGCREFGQRCLIARRLVERGELNQQPHSLVDGQPARVVKEILA